MKEATAATDVKYQRESTEDWARLVRATFSVKPGIDDGDWIYTGHCPRCHHETYNEICPEGGVGVPWPTSVRDALAPAKPKVISLVVVCTCQSLHDGRPAGLDGCGMYAQVYFFEGQMSPEPWGAAAATPDRLDWQRRADSSVQQSLDRVHSEAARWAGAIAGVTGILGITAVVKGPQDFTKVADPTLGWVAVGAILAAVFLAAGAIYKADAAGGTPHHLVALTASAYRKQYLNDFRSGVKDLKVSKWLAVLALCFVVCAVVITWVDSPAAPATRVLVSGPNGVVCGNLVASGGSWLAVSLQKGDPALVIPASDVRAPSSASCP